MSITNHWSIASPPPLHAKVKNQSSVRLRFSNGADTEVTAFKQDSNRRLGDYCNSLLHTCLISLKDVRKKHFYIVQIKCHALFLLGSVSTHLFICFDSAENLT